MSAAYATSLDLTALGISAAALASFPQGQQAQAIAAASDEADSYLGARFILPLTAWGQDLRKHVAAMAVYGLLAARGYNPDADENTTIRDRYKDAVKWLENVAAEKATPVVTDSSVGEGDDSGGPFVLQASVSAPTNYSPLTIGGAPPSVRETSVGTITVGPPRLRGW